MFYVEQITYHVDIVHHFKFEDMYSSFSFVNKWKYFKNDCIENGPL